MSVCVNNLCVGVDVCHFTCVSIYLALRFLSFSNHRGISTAIHQHVSRQVAKTVYVDGMGSVPNSPSDTRKHLLSRSSSPAFANRSCSPKPRKPCSQSSSNDNGSRKSLAKQSSSVGRVKNIRRTNSMLAMPTHSSKSDFLKTGRQHKVVQRSDTVSAKSDNVTRTTRRPNRLSDSSSYSPTGSVRVQSPTYSLRQSDTFTVHSMA